MQTPPASAAKLLATNFDDGTPPSIPAGIKPVLPTPATFTEARRAGHPLALEANWFGPASGRMAVYAFTAEAQDFIVLGAETRAISAAYLAALRRIFYLSFPVLLLVAGLAGYWFAQTACAPIAAMTGGNVQVQLSRNCQHAELQISDTGLGIPAAAAAQVFERFYHVDKARTRTDGCSGSTFRVALPLER